MSRSVRPLDRRAGCPMPPAPKRPAVRQFSCQILCDRASITRIFQSFTACTIACPVPRCLTHVKSRSKPHLRNSGTWSGIVQPAALEPGTAQSGHDGETAAHQVPDQTAQVVLYHRHDRASSAPVRLGHASPACRSCSGMGFQSLMLIKFARRTTPVIPTILSDFSTDETKLA